MNLGTADIVEDIEEPKRKRSSLSAGSGPGGNGGGKKNPGGGGSDGPKNEEPDDDRDTFTDKKSKILTWFVMMVVMMTFGGLLAAYMVISNNKLDEWRPFDLPFELWISTFLIVASSATYSAGLKYTVANDHRLAKTWFLATAFIGWAFILSQIAAWFVLSRRGLIMLGNPYIGFFYMLTAVHAAHVIGGIVALGTVLRRSWLPATNDQDHFRRVTLAQVVGWYWHFIGVIWIVLFIVLGFWK
ncbi:MAG: cytochrome c oxidase subunit 3 [Acidobacteriota bacterium]